MTQDLDRLDGILAGFLRLILPLVLILSSVWVILHTARIWVPLEYRMPGFPADPYGFTLEDRVYWSQVDIHYLLSDSGIDFFDDYRLENGEPMHNERELRHMEDVKVLIGWTWRVLGAGWVLAWLSAALLQRRRGWRALVAVVQAGARATLWLMVLLGVGLVIAFGVLFVGFHRIFFEGDSWLFAYSDTFIRLYPERFWRDTFALVALVTLLFASAFAWIPAWVLKGSRLQG